MTFGEKLQKYRNESNMTQAELAAAVGVGTNTINNYENGRTYPQNREVYARLAEVLKVDPDYLHNENDDFIAEAQKRYGQSGKKQAESLVSEIRSLFAGGELSDDEKDGVMQALEKAYWDCKKQNIAKYSSKNK